MEREQTNYHVIAYKVYSLDLFSAQTLLTKTELEKWLV
jgi:hypothetical protein